jgi:hypothetical protein
MMVITGLDGQIKKIVINGGVLDLSSNTTDYVPESRILTINGVSYDLSADRSWTVTGGATLDYSINFLLMGA